MDVSQIAEGQTLKLVGLDAGPSPKALELVSAGL